MTDNRKFKMTPRGNQFMLWGGTIIVLYSVISFIVTEDIKSNSSLLFILGLSFLFRVYLGKTSYIKTDTTGFYIKEWFTPKKIMFSDILSYKTLVTGDLELNIKDKQLELSKDMLGKEDFEELKGIIIKAIQ